MVGLVLQVLKIEKQIHVCEMKKPNEDDDSIDTIMRVVLSTCVCMRALHYTHLKSSLYPTITLFGENESHALGFSILIATIRDETNSFSAIVHFETRCCSYVSI